MGGNIPDYVNRGVLLPLEQYAGTILDTDAIDESAIESGTLNGHLYGVSTGVTMPALVYNKSMLERLDAPLPDVTMTYAEFRDYLVTLKDYLPEGVYPMMDIGAMSSNSTPFGYWARYNGTPLYDAENNTTPVTAAAARKYLELFQDYRENGLVPPADIAAGFAETNADTSAIVAGKVAIGYLFTNQLGGYQAAMTDELDLIEFPGAAATKALWQAPSQFYTVNKDSAQPEETVKFINFLVNSPDAARVLGNNRGASASATARAAGASDINDQKVLEYLNVSGPHTSAETPHVPNDTELNSTLYLIYQQVAFGQLTPAQGGQQIHDMLVRLINK
jgi:multiple sugar transport system substrate-binding protein